VVNGFDVVVVARASITGARSNELVAEVEQVLLRAEAILG
jgi:RNase P protein component